MPINFYLRALCFFLPYLLNRLFLFLQHFRPQETQLSNFRRIEVLRPFAMVCPKSYIYDYYLLQSSIFIVYLPETLLRPWNWEASQRSMSKGKTENKRNERKRKQSQE